MHRSIALVGSIVAGLLSSGCTLVGLGLGAATPAYEMPVTLSELEARSATGASTEVRVSVRGGGALSASQGIYAGQVGDLVSVTSARGTTFLRIDDVERIEERTGSRWATGLAIGGAIDLALILATVVVISSAHVEVIPKYPSSSR